MMSTKEPHEVRLGTAMLPNGRALTVVAVLNGYRNNQATVVQLYEDGEPYSTLSVNLYDSGELDPDEIFVKLWSENEHLAEPMLESGLFAATGVRSSSGLSAPLWKIISTEFAKAIQQLRG